jgi:general stress protein 26
MQVFLWYSIWSYEEESFDYSRKQHDMSTGATNQQLNFLQEKIREIGSAIFFNLSNSVLKLPTSIVTSLEVDDYGFVWFFIQKPKQNVREFENEFPVRLDFFRKGKDCFLQVNGKGWVVTDPEEMNAFVTLPDEAKKLALNEMVLVKVKITKAEYYETRATRQSWWQAAASSFTTWFRNSNNYRPDIYYPAS